MDRLCPVCGRPLGKNKTYCSRACYAKSRQHYRACAVCGKLFACPPSADTVCCSDECSREHRQRMAAEKASPQLARGRAKMADLPYCQPDENYHHAGTWVLQAPDGKIYECRNLLYWCRQHPELIGEDPARAWRGINVIKASIKGTRKKNRCYQWRGWRLLSWGE